RKCDGFRAPPPDDEGRFARARPDAPVFRGKHHDACDDVATTRPARGRREPSRKDSALSFELRVESPSDPVYAERPPDPRLEEVPACFARTAELRIRIQRT